MLKLSRQGGQGGPRNDMIATWYLILHGLCLWSGLICSSELRLNQKKGSFQLGTSPFIWSGFFVSVSVIEVS